MFTIGPDRLAALRREEGGSVAILFALCLFALVMMVGLAIDIGRAVHTKTKLIDALDAAALAAAKSMHDTQMSTSAIKALAQRFFETNLGKAGKPTFGSVGEFSAIVDRQKSTVTVSATADVPTLFARIAGFETMRLPGTSVAAFDPKDIELGLSLDVTGSMCNPCSKIEDLQAAARDLVDILLSSTRSSNKVRIGLAPFAAGVNGGAYAVPASNKRGPDSCVFERDGADQATDAGPGAGGYLKVAGEPGVANTRDNCPAGAEVMALSDDAGALKRSIDKLRAGGSTAGHLGTAWAWYLVSPKWASVWSASSRPVDYGDKKTIKAVVLMTDGVYNTFGGACDRGCTNVSSQARKSQDLARGLCSNMKAQNVKVYTVGFKLDDRLAEAVLRDCASSALTFYRADDGNQLRRAFQQIADDLLRLRLSQ